jgi:Xaa-Pro aminopeptidase
LPGWLICQPGKMDGTSRNQHHPLRERRIDMPKKNSDQEKIELTYTGRRWIGGGKFHYAYIRKDTGKLITFNRKLMKSHEIGETYPGTVEPSARGEGFFAYGAAADSISGVEDARQVADWVRLDEETARAIKSSREIKTIEAAARKAARTIKAQYNRASNITRRAVIRALIEELEG